MNLLYYEAMAQTSKKYWLMKSEPEVFGIDSLMTAPQQKTAWEGVRNYQVRNFMMKEMQFGDLVFFYHSNAQPTGIVGLMSVCSTEAHPDETQFDKKSEYYDSKATRAKPIWYCVDVQFIEKYSQTLSLEVLRKETQLTNMPLLQKGSRLSITLVSPQEFEHIQRLLKKALV